MATKKNAEDAARSAAAADLGRRGGFARAKALTKRELSAGGKLAANARWAKAKKEAAAKKAANKTARKPISKA